MGTDYYAYAIIGLRVEPEKLFETVHETKRNCKCDVPTDSKFCPSCGKRMFRNVVRKEFVFESEFNEWEDNANIKGYKVVFGTSNAVFDNGEYTGEYMPEEAVIAARYVASHPWNGEVSFRNIDDDLGLIRKNMKDRLYNTGLWDDRKFGLHVILRVSY